MGLFLLFGVTKLALAMMTALNVLTGVGIVYYSIRVARALFGSEVIALLVGIVMALHPVFVFSVATYHALNIYILLLLIVFDLTLSTRRQTYALSVLVGVLAGIAALVRTEYLVLVGAIILGSLITHRQWKMTAVAAVAAFVVIAPWTARNYAVFHRLIPVANYVGNNLFKGYNPEANGSGKWVENNEVAERLLGRELDAVPLNRNYENARDKVFYNAAIDYMKSHPLRSFVVLPMYRVALFWIYDIYHTDYPSTAISAPVLAVVRAFDHRARHGSAQRLFRPARSPDGADPLCLPDIGDNELYGVCPLPHECRAISLCLCRGRRSGTVGLAAPAAADLWTCGLGQFLRLTTTSFWEIVTISGNRRRDEKDHNKRYRLPRLPQ